MLAVTQQRPPATGTGVTQAGAIGVDLGLFHVTFKRFREATCTASLRVGHGPTGANVRFSASSTTQALASCKSPPKRCTARSCRPLLASRQRQPPAGAAHNGSLGCS